MDCFVFNFFICLLLFLALVYACYVFYDTFKDAKEKRLRERMKNRKIDYVLSQVYYNNQHLIKLEKVLDCIELNISEIIDYINDNECSVKDDE